MIKSKAKSLRTLLYEYLVKRRGRWVNGGELEKYAELFFYKGSTGARRLRELNHDGFIHSQKRPGKLSMVKSVWYCIPKLKKAVKRK